LAREGPLAKNPSSYIRFIYNRVNLEKAVIRAAAVSALASYAHKVPSLRQSIVLLLRKCLNDSDDEVRERAFFYLSVLGESEGISEEVSSLASSNDQAQTELNDFRTVLFDQCETIDVDALEQFVMDQKDTLVAEDGQDFTVDISGMIMNGQTSSGGVIA